MEYLNREKEQFKNFFEAEGVNDINARVKVLELFLQSKQHITSDELTEIAVKNGDFFSKSFVEDTLNLMCKFGFASKNRFDNNGDIKYEHKHLGRHHDHIICVKCQKIVEFNNEDIEYLQMKVAAANDFYILQHKMEIYGICSACLKKRPKIISLAMAKAGERLIVKDVIGGIKVKMRILTMGLKMGDEIEIITNYGRGELVIAAGHNRLMLGQGMADKIFAEPIT
ncbi:MAG: transcriptional repressor [Deltaproteobacteria bacterium]|nr:transcriptional repressor [Deltaproteobacteria bacterium]